MGSTEKNGSQRQKLTRKISKNSKVDFNFKLKSALFLCVNFSAVSLTSVLSASHKNPQKIFSVLVFWLPKRQNKTNSRRKNTMIQQQKTYRFSDDTVITEQNIRQIGELIALSSVRTRMIHSTRDLYYVFQNLYKDIYCHTDILKPYSEAYDYAEEAICFLCRFLGKKLGDLCIGKFGKPLPIRLACYRHMGRLI